MGRHLSDDLGPDHATIWAPNPTHPIAGTANTPTGVLPPPRESRVVVGIDPGSSGGLAVLGAEDSVVWFRSMPPTEGEVWALLQPLSGRPAVAYLEQVSGYIGVGHPGSSMFNFGVGYGGLRMALVAAGVTFHTVRPQTWQKVLGIKGKGRKEDDTAWKNRLKTEAQRRFPGLVVTKAVADALLIALYGWHNLRETA